MHKKFYIICTAVIFVVILYSYVITHSYPYGFTGVTYKDGGTGCICHNFEPSVSTKVFFSGPDSVAAGQSVNFMLKVVNQTGITGGFDAAVFNGLISPVISDTTLRLDSTRGELTHKFPKQFVNDTVYWTFKYTAPPAPQVDTLYAVGNSTNNNGLADSSDHWNFSPNFKIKVYIPISVNNNSNIAEGFELKQNYPNPFNPETNIEFKVGKKELINISIYDITGKTALILVNTVKDIGTYKVKLNASGLSSGIYFYVFRSSSYSSTKKMIVMK